jgi:hypothetical protein
MASAVACVLDLVGLRHSHDDGEVVEESFWLTSLPIPSNGIGFG